MVAAAALWLPGLWRQWMSVDPIMSKKLMPSNDVPGQMLKLLVELLRSGELPELAIGGAWMAAWCCLMGRPGVGPLAMELGLIELAAEHVRAIRSLGEVVSISRGRAGRAIGMLWASSEVTKAFAGQATRPDLDAMVSSGLFDVCLEIVAAVTAAGVTGLRDTNHEVLYKALNFITSCGHQPGCEAKIRGVGSALGFCLENSLDVMEEVGRTTGAAAAKLCCSIFGRDEGGSGFTFTQQHVDMLITNWSQYVRAVGYYANVSPSADIIFALQMSVSDANKPLLLANKDFIPYLVDALLLDPDHPRAGMKEQLKAWCQQHHCEAIAQLAVFEPAREALLEDGSVVPALEAVSAGGLSKEARDLAAAALAALSDRKLQMVMDGQKHVMLSCECLHCFNQIICAQCWLSDCGVVATVPLAQTNGMCRPRSNGSMSH
eukprot:COSAG06_NODE_31_length_31488_cov_60.882793_35_plen_433_part_00